MESSAPTTGIDPTLQDRIRSSRSLPSPPVVAAQLIELAGDPNAGVAEIYDVLKIDPALSTRLLRLANSPLYARRRRTETVPQAIMKLGFDAVITAALSLTLLSRQRRRGGGGVSFERRWTRNVHAAVTAQVLAARTRRVGPADAFLAALLQDIGVLVIDQLEPDTYVELDASSTEADVVAAEQRALGCDHSSVGAELLSAWRLPEHIVSAVALSHRADEVGRTEVLVAMIAVGELVADWIAGDADALTIAADLARSTLDVEDADFSTVLAEVADALPDLTALLEAELPPDEVLQEMATEAIISRQLHQQEAVAQLRRDLESLQRATAELEQQSRSDPITGLFNRRMIERLLTDEHRLAVDLGAPLSVLFIDLDYFKSVNEYFGHHGGDELLVQMAARLTESLRGSDHLGRWGGDEFVAVLPATPVDRAVIVADRLVHAARSTTFAIQRQQLQQSLSIGIASTEQLPSPHTVQALLTAADTALFDAKAAGKNRFRVHRPVESQPPPVRPPMLFGLPH